jgi:copper chaperone CopZ
MQTSNKNEVYVGNKVPANHVRRLKLYGIQNCCGPCCDAITAAIRRVEGVTGNTAEPGESHFEVTGDFSPAEVIEALHGAGFHAEIDQ